MGVTKEASRGCSPALRMRTKAPCANPRPEELAQQASRRIFNALIDILSFLWYAIQMHSHATPTNSVNLKTSGTLLPHSPGAWGCSFEKKNSMPIENLYRALASMARTPIDGIFLAIPIHPSV